MKKLLVFGVLGAAAIGGVYYFVKVKPKKSVEDDVKSDQKKYSTIDEMPKELADKVRSEVKVCLSNNKGISNLSALTSCAAAVAKKYNLEMPNQQTL
jgi:hypothetical protein